MASKINPIDFVKSYYAAIEVKNFDYVRDNSTEDMHFSGPVPQPLDRKSYVEFLQLLYRAFPDWRFNLTNFKQVGDRVTFQGRITATHSGTLDLPFMDVHSYQPTGKRIQLPTQEYSLFIRDGKVARIDVVVPKGGGVWGLLDQVGYHVTQSSKTK
jgi:predicted ester cyclase